MVWRHVAHSLQGSSHAAEGSPCQDSGRVEVIGTDDSTTLIACVADGAGSAKHSGAGSVRAADTIIELAAQHDASCDGFGDLQREDIVRWCQSARKKIQADADARDCSTREFATTLCVALVSENFSSFFQIGDGAIILGTGGVYGVVFWPQSGEYANTTNFLTADNFQDHLQFHSSTGSFSDVALFTDGLERLALNFDKRTPHPPFFNPLFGALRTTDDSQNLGEDLRRFLQSESVQNRSDDDKTLILASRSSG